jgi:hypothetical protein
MERSLVGLRAPGVSRATLHFLVPGTRVGTACTLRPPAPLSAPPSAGLLF